MKKNFFVFIIICIILLLGIPVGCYHDDHIIPAKENKAYSMDELKQLYDVYRDDFNDVAKIVLKNDPMIPRKPLYARSITKEGRRSS